MAHRSAAADLALHGARVLGFTTAASVAARYGLEPAAVDEFLLDYEARGWARQTSFGGSSGWSLTEAGRGEDERRLAAELSLAGARPAVAAAHQRFLPLNQRFAVACTDWQLRPTPRDAMAFNDHSDWRWDERVLADLASLGGALADLCAPLSACLARFGGYQGLYDSALGKAGAGQHGWVDAPDRDSCHLVWIQFHEDLLATLGIPRGSDT